MAADVSAAAFVALVSGRRGHFRLESGHHSRLWLDLDALFSDTRAVAPFVAALADALRRYDVDAVCGPLLGGAFLAQRVAQALGADFHYAERIDPQHERGLFEVRYRLPAAIQPRVRGRRVAMVDDVMSAGSALRGTFAELRAHGALPVVAGALLVLGDVGAEYFRQRDIPVEAAARDAFELWAPEACPLCAAGMPVDDPASPGA
jgi:orotate phosphoribosyltransferase